MSKIFCLQRKFNNALQDFHVKEKIYACEKCDKTFSNVQNLRRHNRGVHEKIKPCLCTLCNKTYIDKAYLQLHIQSLHLKQKTHACKICDKTFHWAMALKNHLQTHVDHSGIRYKCEKCEKEFTSKNRLSSHFKRVHENIQDSK